MARVELSEDAREDLHDLDRSVQLQILKALQKLRDNPSQRGQPLGRRGDSNLTTFRKLVVGDRDYRVVYRVQDDGTVVIVWVIGRRSDGEAYELALARLRMHSDSTVRELTTSLEELWQERGRT